MATIDDIKYDAQGLVPAVLIDCDTREVLMVAWMNAESLAITLETRLATFWSRSRQELWTKGLTSGNLMHVQAITADCDCDTLLVEVHPDGPACHKGTTSCFTDPLFPTATTAPTASVISESGSASASAVLKERIAHYGESLDDFTATLDGLGEPFDLHMHTTCSDGDASPAEMAEAACELGLSAIAITDHSYTDFDVEYCMARDAHERYQADVRAVAERFTDRITVLCGLEQDMFSAPAPEGYDFLIGSAHYVEVPVECAEAAGGHVTPDGMHCYVSVDETEELFVRAAEACFDGDYLAFAEAYFLTVSAVIARTGAQAVGHFDLFAKYNEGNKYFDEGDPRYVRAWQYACDVLLATGAVFEINHGACIDGRRGVPYPAPAIQEYLRDHGARFIKTSDAHSIEALRALWA